MLWVAVVTHYSFIIEITKKILHFSALLRYKTQQNMVDILNRTINDTVYFRCTNQITIAFGFVRILAKLTNLPTWHTEACILLYVLYAYLSQKVEVGQTNLAMPTSL